MIATSSGLYTAGSPNPIATARNASPTTSARQRATAGPSHRLGSVPIVGGRRRVSRAPDGTDRLEREPPFAGSEESGREQDKHVGGDREKSVQQQADDR